ncbi:MAG: DNA gyrase subunit A, partial [Clostridia bacterium]|nr:DNA gyrase subunit A [Clostridia bacterium]
SYQEEVLRRRTEFELKKARDRAHILEGLARAIDIVDEIIATIRACTGGSSEAKQALMDKFGFDDPQASAIVAYRLGQLAGLEIKKIMDELDTLHGKIEEYVDLLEHEEKILALVKSEAQEIGAKFSDERRTEICNVSGEVDIEDLIPVEESVITLTHGGYIKRQTTDSYRIQKRGGRGVNAMTQKDEDYTETMFTCSSHDEIMFFTSFGRAYRLKAYEIPEGSRTSRGMNVVNVLQLMPNEKVTSMLKIELDDPENTYICMVTRTGIIKRTRLMDFKNIRRSGIIAINLDEDDELAWVKLTHGDDDLIVATREGMSIRFHEQDARTLGRTARGVKSITFKKKGDEIVGFDVVDPAAKVLTVSETGYGRRSSPDDYKVQKRGGSGLLNYRVEKYGKVAAIRMVREDEDLIMISSNGVMIRIECGEINVVSRPAKGVKVMRIKDDDRLITISTAEHKAEEEEPKEEVESPLENGTEAPESVENTETDVSNEDK